MAQSVPVCKWEISGANPCGLGYNPDLRKIGRESFPLSADNESQSPEKPREKSHRTALVFRFHNWIRGLNPWKTVRRVLAVFFFFIAFIGLLLPIVPQTPFIVAGLLLLGFDPERILRLLERFLPGFTAKTSERVRKNRFVRRFTKKKP